VFRADSDRCGDFYEYVFVRLEKILMAYRETEAKFVTWFTVVLRNRYLNFIRERKSKNSIGDNYRFISLDYSNGKTQSLHNLIGVRDHFPHSEHSGYEALLERIVRNLNKNQRIFFHLYYIDTIRPEDMGFISITLNRTVKDVLSSINKLKDGMVRKYEMKSDTYEKLNLLYHEILRKQKDGKIESAQIMKNKQNKLLQEYWRIKLNPSYSSLADFLNQPLGTVSTGISRMKSAVRGIIGEFKNEKLSFS
jgi:DNA-directed RNA polymerase specialized sigma24 family protein